MFRVEKLNSSHAIGDFDCGVEALDRFLAIHALPSQSANSAQTYVGVSGEAIVGYHTLTVGEVKHEFAPLRLKKGLAAHPVPVIVLARLAVDRRFRGIGAGAGLLKDAAARALRVAEIAGARAMVVHAKDEGARRFYEHFDFVAGFDNPLHLYMLVKELKSLAG